jgi:MFS family permease
MSFSSPSRQRDPDSTSSSTVVAVTPPLFSSDEQPHPDIEKFADPTSSTEVDTGIGDYAVETFPPPPDGGTQAWIQVICAHVTIFNTWGYINSFGLFQTYQTTLLSRPPAAISWIGSTQIFLLFFIGTFSGRLADAGYFRATFSVGLVLQLLGVFMTSVSTKYWQFFLCEGVCTGIGNGLIFCPSLAVVSTWFSTKRGLACGLAACGTATGGIVFPVLAQHLIPKIGFPWTVRVMAFIMLGLMIIPLTFTKTRLPPRRTGQIVDWAAFKELPFVLFAAGVTLCFWGLYFAFYYVSEGPSMVNEHAN